ncbi:LysR family transcriptional regulator [Aestuariicella hydrocarbonica]|uniref:LysR family transcriptional regulator n=1 Tax=Pseudomaricurvus hydrocarbonicus TaxID=1470433 RepID=A0A9E5MK44_9GAMM|nr:LysR substrate-binding domain-containing protein [Aestuariicella hydrocarbonica]NHO64882.1 LysR family transcriptional regulator [Aestuariicella hydrocarbonica]
MSRNPITLEALDVLDAIERRGSFAKAAEELNKATSALSYTVQKLEEQLEVTLFQRQGRRSVLTPAGELLLTEGRDILNATAILADRTKELATGWEPRLAIAIESIMDYPKLFAQLNEFLLRHPGIELDITECVLGGGWDALEHGRADLIIGSPGPAPTQKGFRTVPLGLNDMIPVVANTHPLAASASDPETLKQVIHTARRVITHDTTATNVARTAGLADGKQRLYVQNMDQKQAAICSGIGIGHLPLSRIAPLLKAGKLVELRLYPEPHPANESFLAWKVSHKGKALKALTDLLQQALPQP